jgi:hypothetical protein
MFTTAHERSAAEAPADVNGRQPALLSSGYPAAHRFPGYLLSERKLAQLHDAAGSFRNYTLDDVARLRALPQLDPPGPFTPKNRQWVGRAMHEHTGPKTWPTKRRLGALHRVKTKHQFKEDHHEQAPSRR